MCRKKGRKDQLPGLALLVSALSVSLPAAFPAALPVSAVPALLVFVMPAAAPPLFALAPGFALVLTTSPVALPLVWTLRQVWIGLMPLARHISLLADAGIPFDIRRS